MKGSSNSQAAAKNGANNTETQSSSTTIYEATRKLQSIQNGKVLSLDQAVHFTIDCACKTLMYALCGMCSIVKPLFTVSNICSLIPILPHSPGGSLGMRLQLFCPE